MLFSLFLSNLQVKFVFHRVKISTLDYIKDELNFASKLFYYAFFSFTYFSLKTVKALACFEVWPAEPFVAL